MTTSPAVSRVHLLCQGLLFDMDGILISSLASVERCWTRWSTLRGINPADALSVVHGRRAIDTVRAFRPDLDAHAELRLIEDMEMADMADLRVLPGVRALLAELPPDRWTVVTSSTARLAAARLGAAGIPLPSRLVTADDVTHGKPDPEPYRTGAALLGVAPADCVVFEDAPSGVGAGRAAGCKVIATTFSHSPEALSDATYILPDLAGLGVEAQPGGVDLSFTPLAR